MRRGVPAAAVAFAISLLDVYDLISRVCVCVLVSHSERTSEMEKNPIHYQQTKY